MKVFKVASVVLAVHVTVLAFFFYKPTVRYFAIICLSTVFVWGTLFSLKIRRALVLFGGVIVQLFVHRYAYNSWLSQQSTLWWPLVQFLALQYIVALRFLEPEETPVREVVPRETKKTQSQLP